MKLIMKSILFMLALTVVLCWDVPESESLHYMFESVDANEDGRIDRQEFSKDMKKSAFDKLDSDDDKKITEAEWVSLDNITVRKKHNKLFKTIDIDKDRKITFFEFSSYADKHSNLEEAFIGLDMDKDGLLVPDEITIRPVFRWITIYF